MGWVSSVSWLRVKQFCFDLDSLLCDVLELFLMSKEQSGNSLVSLQTKLITLPSGSVGRKLFFYYEELYLQLLKYSANWSDSVKLCRATVVVRHPTIPRCTLFWVVANSRKEAGYFWKTFQEIAYQLERTWKKSILGFPIEICPNNHFIGRLFEDGTWNSEGWLPFFSLCSLSSTWQWLYILQLPGNFSLIWLETFKKSLCADTTKTC